MSWTKLREAYRQVNPIVYDEIPIMISQSGKLVCIESKGDMTDMPTIGITGTKGGGKSRMMHTLVDMVYHKKPNDTLAIVNDISDESLTYAIKSHCNIGEKVYGEQWKKQLGSIGLRPMRLPIVNCYPSGISKSISEIPENVTSIKIALQHERLFEVEELFAKLDKSITHFRMIKPDLIKAKNMQEMLDTIDTVPNKESKEKITRMILFLFQARVIDFNDDVITKSFFFDRRKNEKVQLNPIMALMAMRCIPAIMTGIIPKNIIPNYLRLMIEDLFQNQKQGYFKKNQINTWAFIDELPSVDVGETSLMLQRMVKEGRPNRIATVWASQFYKKASDGIRSNTKYLISFRYNSHKEVNEIMSDFDLTQSQANAIKHLNKDYFECVAMTSDEYFVMYDLKTGERTRHTGYIRGYSIPPLSLHRPPKFFMPKSNVQYAIVYMKEKGYRLGNERTGKVIFSELDKNFQNRMKYEELGETSFLPEQFNLRLFAPQSHEIITIALDELQVYGYNIYSAPVNPYERRFKQQSIIYGLVRKNERIVFYARIMNYCPKDVTIEMNPFKQMVRLRSANISGGATPWREIYA